MSSSAASRRPFSIASASGLSDAASVVHANAVQTTPSATARIGLDAGNLTGAIAEALDLEPRLVHHGEMQVRERGVVRQRDVLPALERAVRAADEDDR